MRRAGVKVRGEWHRLVDGEGRVNFKALGMAWWDRPPAEDFHQVHQRALHNLSHVSRLE
jgi:hypothetical protein